jgi:hypothetical protein
MPLKDIESFFPTLATFFRVRHRMEARQGPEANLRMAFANDPPGPGDGPKKRIHLSYPRKNAPGLNRYPGAANLLIDAAGFLVGLGGKRLPAGRRENAAVPPRRQSLPSQ